jgi:hypothetical protein
VGLVVGAIIIMLALTVALFFMCGKKHKEKETRRDVAFEPVA